MEKSHDLIGVNIPAFEWKAQEQWRRSGGNDGKYKYIYIYIYIYIYKILFKERIEVELTR